MRMRRDFYNFMDVPNFHDRSISTRQMLSDAIQRAGYKPDLMRGDIQELAAKLDFVERTGRYAILFPPCDHAMIRKT